MSAAAPGAFDGDLRRGAEAAAPSAFVDDALVRAASEGRSAFVVLPAPRAALDAPLDAVLAIGAALGASRGSSAGLAPDALLFAPSRARAGDGWIECAGWGAAVRLEANGPDRFELLRREAERHVATTSTYVHPAAEAPPPVRFFGGLSFEDTPRDPWGVFHGASFVLPRLALVRDGARALLLVAASADEAASPVTRRATIAELEASWAHLAHGRWSAPARPATVPVARRSEPELDGWFAELSALRRVIAAGVLDKAVAARRTIVDAGAPWDVAAVLAALERAPSRPGAVRFAFERGGSTFLGLTPERLVKKRGSVITTEALAGSAPASDGVEHLHTAKTEEEHAIVVRMIRARLAGVADDVVVHAPEHRSAGPVVHLATPISARAAEGTHVLSLAEALHPTPAVCGWPVDAARRFLTEHERWSRGWYAGPVGWFDAHGDGELFVALRSALISGARAITFAGAGIVRGSDAEDEWREIGLKEATVLRALGVEP